MISNARAALDRLHGTLYGDGPVWSAGARTEQGWPITGHDAGEHRLFARATITIYAHTRREAQLAVHQLNGDQFAADVAILVAALTGGEVLMTVGPRHGLAEVEAG